MNEVKSSIPVLSFYAGELRLGIAAEDVLAVVPARPGIPHIAEILGVIPSPAQAERRVIHVAAPAEERSAGSVVVEFQADSPVGVIRCQSEQILPMSDGLLLRSWRPVMGFANIEGHVLILLDIPSIIDALLKHRAGEDS